MELKVRDLYEGAYLLCRGFHLKTLTIVDSRGKPKAVFVIEGNGIKEVSEAYRTGQATVNVALLKFTLEKLKDAMFAKIRAEQALSGKEKKEQEHVMPSANVSRRKERNEWSRTCQTAN